MATMSLRLDTEVTMRREKFDMKRKKCWHYKKSEPVKFLYICRLLKIEFFQNIVSSPSI